MERAGSFGLLLINRMLKTKLTLIAALAGIAAISSAQQLSEIFVNPPGTDGGREFIELQGPANFNWTGYKLAVIDGDNTVAGLVDVVITLDGAVSGSNGILLIRKSGTPFDPAPSPDSATFILSLTNATNLTDLENGSVTFILGAGAWPTGTLDFDVPNTGTFNTSLLGSFAVADAVSWEENDSTTTFDYGYANQISSAFSNFAADLGFTPDFGYRVKNSTGSAFLGWAVGDALAANLFGPFTNDPGEFVTNVPGYTQADFVQLDPGNVNQLFNPVAATTLNINLTVLDYSFGNFAGRTATIEVTDSSSVVHSFAGVSISATGVASVTLPNTVSLGSASVRVKMSHSLGKIEALTLAAGVNTKAVTCLNGDIDGDNFVGLDDFNSLSNSFNLGEGDTGYVDLADLDGDKFVGLDDFNILSNTFNVEGE